MTKREPMSAETSAALNEAKRIALGLVFGLPTDKDDRCEICGAARPHTALRPSSIAEGAQEAYIAGGCEHVADPRS